MKIVIIGAGLIGVTTAYYLKRSGHEVTVIERGLAPGRETSFANGSLLTPSMPEPWNAPGCWRVLLSSLARSDAALLLRVKALPALGRWGIEFLHNSRADAHERNVLKNLRLALYSLEMMALLRQQTGIEYGRAARGTLKLFRDMRALDRTVVASETLAARGLNLRRLTAHETIELEPALAPVARDLAGAIYYAKDEVGNAYDFCVALAEHARGRGVEFRFGAAATSFELHAGQIKAVRCGRERISADGYVLAAGSYTLPLLKQVGLWIPVQPAKGYSVTFDLYTGAAPLRIPVIDDDYHAAVVPLGKGLRVAGTAEFCGFDLTLRPERIRNLLTLLQKVLPRSNLDPSTAKPWCGLRPMSADGVPIIGKTPISNLFLNSGHGHLGWTMAAGSAHLLADLIDHKQPSLDPDCYSIDRFKSADG